MAMHHAASPSAGSLEGDYSRSLFGFGLLMAGATFCATGAARLEPDAIGDLGILTIMTWHSWVGLALLVAGFFLSLEHANSRPLLPGLFLLALIAALHLVPAYAYGTLRYSWAWKHIGIVDYIMRNGRLDRDAVYLSAYHNWPGFFVACAWLAQRLSLDPLKIASLAAYAPPVFATANLLVLQALFLKFTEDRRLVLLALFIFLVGNWIGQDYFAPQSATFLLYLIAMLLCVGPLSGGQTGTSRGLRLLFWKPGVTPPSDGLALAPAAVAEQPRLVASLLLLAISLTITASHPLTPVVLVSALCGLALLGGLDLGFALFAACAVVLWNLYFAAPFVAASISSELENLGSVFFNATEKIVDLRQLSHGQMIVALISRLMTAGLVGLAAIGFLRRLRSGHVDLPLLAILAAPLPVLVITSYGGEAIFRVYLFMLPTLAFLGAAVVFPSSGHTYGFWKAVAVALVGYMLVAGFLVSNNGKDQQYRFRQNEVDAASWLYHTAPAGTLLIEGARNYPSQFSNYENFTYVPLSSESPQARQEIIQDPAGVFDRWLSDSRWPAGFVILTQSQKAYAETQGIVPEGTFDRIIEALSSSPRFRIVYRNEDAVIFSLNDWAPAGSAS
nr:hypothetical protein REQ54_00018 [Rhizobium sp. Q54]